MGMLVDFEATCPVDGTRFVHAGTPGYSIFGRALDGLPHGSWFFPIALPECPACRFPAVFGALDGCERRAAECLVASETWNAAGSETSYWRLNAAEIALGRSTAMRRIDRLLSATWQTYGDPGRYGRYARELGLAMNAGGGEIRAESIETWATLEVFVANVERQAGDFKGAVGRLDRVAGSGGLGPDLAERVSRTRQMLADGSMAPGFAEG